MAVTTGTVVVVTVAMTVVVVVVVVARMFVVRPPCPLLPGSIMGVQVGMALGVAVLAMRTVLRVAFVHRSLP